MSRAGARMTDFEERDFYGAPPRRSAPELDHDFDPRRRVTTATRSRAPSEVDRTPAFLREDVRRTEAGPMVLRQRQVETIDRHRPRSPSPVRVREERIIRRPKSVSPPPSSYDHEQERSRTRVLERERIRSPSVVRERAPSPVPIRYVERPRRSPSPVDKEHVHTRIVERERERVPTPEPSPPPAPPVIRGPTIEREVITHYRDIDHGVIKVRQPSPPPPPRPQSRMRERETDIDISLSKDRTEVDIRRSTTRGRSKSRERRSDYHDDDLIIRRDDRVRFEEPNRRRAHSAAPLGSPVDEEAEYITSKLDSRGYMGEAWNGATKDWTIVDVPPGTERIRMDGVGGASTDTAFTRYSGVRRTKFIPERDGAPSPAPVPREPSPPPTRDRLNVSVWDREREIDIEKVTDRRPPRPLPAPKDMWTEITKDLVVREAIQELGYEYEETADFFYVMDYLKYDDVLRLVHISDEIRRARKERVREIEWERDYRDDWERTRHRHSGHAKWDDERVYERDFVYDSRTAPRGYLR